MVQSFHLYIKQYDSCDKYVRFYLFHKVTRRKYSVMNNYVQFFLPVDLQSYLINYDHIFRSYGCVVYIKNVLFMQPN